MDIREKIISIEKRPLMFIEEMRLDFIYYIIAGHIASSLGHDKATENDKKFHYTYHKWIYNWIKNNIDSDFPEEDLFFWYHNFRKVTSSEEEAIKLFFQATKEFFEDSDSLENK